MPLAHLAEWEWGWNTPLLLRFEAPAEIREFLAAPLEDFDLAAAERTLAARIAELNTYRIGVYFERVQEALFRAHPGTGSLRTSLVVPGRTEIDLLHRLRALPGTIIHWEVAVKYYLCLDESGSRDPDRYVGPSLKDTLGVKLRTIFRRQLPILADPGIRSAYAGAFGIFPHDRILPIPKMHGLLYLPFRGRAERHRPDEVVSGRSGGAWCTHSEVQAFLDSVQDELGPSARVRLLRDRYDWLRETARIERREDEVPLKNYLNSSLAARIQSHFTENTGPLHCSILGDRGELRFFVVAEGWRDEAERKLETFRVGGRMKS